MEIKNQNRLFFCLILFLSIDIFSSNDKNHKSKLIDNNNASEVKENNLKHNSIKKNNSKNLNKTEEKIFYKYYELDLDKVYRHDGKSFQLINKNNEEIHKAKVYKLHTDEYVAVKSIDNKLRLFNGSIIIKFNQMPDLDNFALLNNLTLVSNLSDVNSAVFRVQNIFLLDTIIRDIKLDKNIINVELSLKDPYVKLR
ncbi:MAG: hypothetical protein VW418_03285 [Gammaproteobacteria bacterium]